MEIYIKFSCFLMEIKWRDAFQNWLRKKCWHSFALSNKSLQRNLQKNATTVTKDLAGAIGIDSLPNKANI